MLQSALYIVPTPIGNLDDITLRALEVLKQADLIAAEDTRHTKVLLDKYGILNKKLISCHDFNEEQRASLIVDSVNNGLIVALVSDAGTPLISDPGFKLIRKCLAQNIKVIPLPGPCAAITALEACAMPTDSFLFKGFLPAKDKEKQEVLANSIKLGFTTIFYESTHRILNTLKMLTEYYPNIEICLCKEMTKSYEAFFRGLPQDILEIFINNPEYQKGEFVLVISAQAVGSNKSIDEKIINNLELLTEYMPVKLACQIVSQLCDLNKNDLYKQALNLKNSK